MVIKFTTEGTERVRIDSSGRTGFNTNSPTNLVDINHEEDSNGELVQGVVLIQLTSIICNNW